jgi:outer membrane protein OmpA-like peptidoglycan-associated protein
VLRDSGVPPNRLVTFGRGEEQPVASNLTPEGRAQNRRVEIIIRPTS